MSLCLKPFWTFFLSPVIKLHITIWKVWAESTYFFSMGYKLEPYESWFVGFQFSLVRHFLRFLSNFCQNYPFSKNYRVCISFGSFWQCELTHLMNLFFGLWEGWINNCNFNWNKKAKMELSKGMKDRSLLTYNKWLILYDS